MRMTSVSVAGFLALAANVVSADEPFCDAIGTLYLPRNHGPVKFEAIYHEKACIRTLSATFIEMKRTS